MTTSLAGKRIAFVVANEGIEQAELVEPWKAVTDAGATALLIAPKPGQVQAFNHLDRADKFPVDVVSAEADAASYDALMLPGGVSNADQIRADVPAVTFVKSFVGRTADGSAQRRHDVGRRRKCTSTGTLSAVASPTIAPRFVTR